MGYYKSDYFIKSLRMLPNMRSYKLNLVDYSAMLTRKAHPLRGHMFGLAAAAAESRNSKYRFLLDTWSENFLEQGQSA